MKRFSEQFKKKSDSIRLRVSERADLRARLESYMEYHPLPAELKTQKQSETKKQVEGIISESFKTISINMTYVRSFAGVFAVFMVVGIPLVAERAVPGDVLYPVKTEITEELRASLKLSPYAKVEWETKRLERRVAEARLLADEGKMTPETEATVVDAVKEHTDAINQEIAVMREGDEDTAAIAEIAFASALSVQSDIFDDYAGSDVDTSDSDQAGHSVTVLADALNTVSEQADVAQTDATPSYEILLGSVETETTRAYELFESVKQRAGEDEITDMERRLADVERKLVEAIVVQTGELYIVQDPDSFEEASTKGQEFLEEVPVPEDSQTNTDAPVDDLDIATDQIVEDGENASTTLIDAVVVAPITQEEKTEQAIVLLRLALTDVQKLIIFMTDIEVRDNVSIDALVPVTFTDEEKVRKVQDVLQQVASIQEEITSRTVQEDFVEKYDLGLVLLAEDVVGANESLGNGNFESAQQKADDALALVNDLRTFTLEQENETEDGLDDEDKVLDGADTATSTEEIVEPEQPSEEVSTPEDVEVVDEV